MIIGLFPNEDKKDAFKLAKEICNFLSEKNKNITVVAEDAAGNQAQAQVIVAIASSNSKGSKGKGKNK